MKSTSSINALRMFGANVKKFRNIKKMTQEQLAECISTSAVQIGRIECGKNACTIQMLLKLCMALEVTPNELFANIEGLPLSDDNTVFLNKFISSHSIQTSETKNFLRHIINYFDLKENKPKK